MLQTPPAELTVLPQTHRCWEGRSLPTGGERKTVGEGARNKGGKSRLNATSRDGVLLMGHAAPPKTLPPVSAFSLDFPPFGPHTFPSNTVFLFPLTLFGLDKTLPVLPVEICVSMCRKLWPEAMRRCSTRVCLSVRWLVASWAVACCWHSESTATDAILAGAPITVMAHCPVKLVSATPTSNLRISMILIMVTY